MSCAYCQQDMNAILTGVYCYARRYHGVNPKMHSPWVIEPIEDLEAY